MMMRLPTNTMSIIASTLSTRSDSFISMSWPNTCHASWKNLKPSASSASDSPRNTGARIQREANNAFSVSSSSLDPTCTPQVLGRAYCSHRMALGSLPPRRGGMPMITKRDLAAAVIAASITLACGSMADEPGKLLDSTAWNWNDFTVRKTEVGELRSVVRQPTRTLDELEMHITTLNPHTAS